MIEATLLDFDLYAYEPPLEDWRGPPDIQQRIRHGDPMESNRRVNHLEQQRRAEFLYRDAKRRRGYGPQKPRHKDHH